MSFWRTAVDEEVLQLSRRYVDAPRFYRGAFGAYVEYAADGFGDTAFVSGGPGGLVLAGMFIHDMGKTEELAYDTAFSYTDSGQLIGHITKTVLMMHKKAEHSPRRACRLTARFWMHLGIYSVASRGVRVRFAQTACDGGGVYGLLYRRP